MRAEKYSLVSDFNQMRMCLQTSVNLANVWFREYPFRVSRVVIYGQTDMPKLRAAFLQQNASSYNQWYNQAYKRQYC
jgi:hypothetical protein